MGLVLADLFFPPCMLIYNIILIVYEQTIDIPLICHQWQWYTFNTTTFASYEIYPILQTLITENYTISLNLIRKYNLLTLTPETTKAVVGF